MSLCFDDGPIQREPPPLRAAGRMADAASDIGEQLAVKLVNNWLQSW